MKPSLFFCDIDGTLLRGKMPIPEKVKEAARRYGATGGRVVLCTGRSPVSTAAIAAEMEVDGPCIVHSGAMLYDFANDRPLRGVAMPDSVREILREMVDGYPEISVQACTADRTYLLRSNEVLRSRGVQEDLERDESALESVRGAIYKIVMTCPDRELLQSCGDKLFAGDEYTFAFASRRFAETVSSGSDKAAAARTMAEEMGVPMEHTFAAGDAMTDYPMLRQCGHSFAPSDAVEEVLRVCDTVIPTCEEGGMEQAFLQAAAMAEAF